MSMSVDSIIDELIGREGGFSDHPSDRGGATRWGITEQVARAFGYGGAMRSLPRERAVEIYRARYWTQPRFNEVMLILPAVAIELFDIAVNMGPSVAVRFLQRALNVLNRGGRSWPDLTVDGQIGAMTLDALRRFEQSRGRQAEAVLLRCLDGQQLVRYLEITEARPANEDFFFGWVAHRIGKLA